jgi:hypothetical protein
MEEFLKEDASRLIPSRRELYALSGKNNCFGEEIKNNINLY